MMPGQNVNCNTVGERGNTQFETEKSTLSGDPTKARAITDTVVQSIPHYSLLLHNACRLIIT